MAEGQALTAVVEANRQGGKPKGVLAEEGGRLSKDIRGPFWWAAPAGVRRVWTEGDRNPAAELRPGRRRGLEVSVNASFGAWLAWVPV